MRIVLSTCTSDRAAEIARALVEEGEAACVNLAPVRSVYRWEGKVCLDEEVLMIIKVAAARIDRLRERLRALHPYTLPEIVVLSVDVEDSLGAYVQWVRDPSRGAG